jgi:SNF2 family DNA or RNA helicase
VDEAHKIKNWETVNFIMLNQYQATFKLLMTGTPLSNNLQELWCLLYFIMPGVF